MISFLKIVSPVIFFSVIFCMYGTSVPGAEVPSDADQTIPVPKIPPVLTVCFIPNDLEPYPETDQRLDRVMKNIQLFYKDNMKRQGFGAVTFNLELSEDQFLKVHYVRGVYNQNEYTRDRFKEIREEVKNSLLREGINIDGNYVVIFQLLLKRKEKDLMEIGPYVGGGTSLSGTAWVYDDPYLDSDLLCCSSQQKKDSSLSSEKSRSLQCNTQLSPKELADFNTLYLGGLAHEMGHMFGLPHNAEHDEERTKLGRSIMGTGNQVYGRDLQGEKTGAFLTKADALRLSRCRAFLGEVPFNNVRPTLDFLELRANFQEKTIPVRSRVSSVKVSAEQIRNNKILNENNSITNVKNIAVVQNICADSFVNAVENSQKEKVSESTSPKTTFPQGVSLVIEGRCAANIPLTGLILYCDSETISSDYDAKTWIAFPDKQGFFRFIADELSEGTMLIRLTGIHENGMANTISVPCFIRRLSNSEKSESSKKNTAGIDPSGLSALNSYVPEQLIRRLFRSWNTERLYELLVQLENQSDADAVLRRKATHLYRLMTTPEQKQIPADLPKDRSKFDLSNAVFSLEETGNGRPMKKIVPEDLFLSVDGTFFESGLYAYAPSVYRTNIGAHWLKFQTAYGLQDGHTGSVIFVIRADGHEIFRSSLICDNQLRRTEVNVSGVQILELVVESGSDGNSRDNAVWIEPVLTR